MSVLTARKYPLRLVVACLATRRALVKDPQGVRHELRREVTEGVSSTGDPAEDLQERIAPHHQRLQTAADRRDTQRRGEVPGGRAVERKAAAQKAESLAGHASGSARNITRLASSGIRHVLAFASARPPPRRR